ncbi:MAG: alpha-amylase/4-alpha-glucanotransferase domain-containing protein, partial [Treponemataceae bacterium]
TGGFDYVLLDSNLFDPDNDPLIIEKQGKSIFALPINTEKQYIQNLQKYIQPETKYSFELYTENDFLKFFEHDDFTKILKTQKDNEQVIFTTPSKILKELNFKKSYISTGVSKSVSFFLETQFKQTGKEQNIKNYLLLSPEILHLYSRMIFTSLFLNQVRGDKMRKKSAQDELWKAQNYLPYIDLENNNSNLHNQAYKHLLTAEKIIRQNNKSFKNLLAIDYNSDGKKEYITQRNYYNTFIHLKGGMLYEFDIIKNNKNYANTFFSDRKKSSYEKKMFVDHFIESKNSDSIKKGNLDLHEPLFANNIYQEIFFNRNKDEFTLKTFSIIDGKKISLRKKYRFLETGITVQYILKNESQEHVTGYFVVENNFLLTELKNDQSTINLISSQSVMAMTSEMTFTKDISSLQIFDPKQNNSFIMELNQNADVTILQNDSSPAYTFLFSWLVDLPVQYEAERTIALFIHPLKN